jgi:hypothetical protein
MAGTKQRSSTPGAAPQEAEAAQGAFVRLRREHEALQNKHRVRGGAGEGGCSGLPWVLARCDNARPSQRAACNLAAWD